MTAFLIAMVVFFGLATVADIVLPREEVDKPATPRQRAMATALRTALLAWALLLLAGHGGGAS